MPFIVKLLLPLAILLIISIAFDFSSFFIQNLMCLIILTMLTSMVKYVKEARQTPKLKRHQKRNNKKDIFS